MEKPTKEFTKLLSDDELQATALQLDTAISEVVAAGERRESVYGEKATLMKRGRELQTEIKLAESNAIMQIQGNGKDAFAIVDGRKIFLTNDTTRDAYRREASRAERTELATVEGKIIQIDIELGKANDTFNTKVEALRGIQSKARLQAALLEYLS